MAGLCDILTIVLLHRPYMMVMLHGQRSLPTYLCWAARLISSYHSVITTAHTGYMNRPTTCLLVIEPYYARTHDRTLVKYASRARSVTPYQAGFSTSYLSRTTRPLSQRRLGERKPIHITITASLNPPLVCSCVWTSHMSDSYLCYIAKRNPCTWLNVRDAA